MTNAEGHSRRLRKKVEADIARDEYDRTEGIDFNKEMLLKIGNSVEVRLASFLFEVECTGPSLREAARSKFNVESEVTEATIRKARKVRKGEITRRGKTAL